MFYVHIIDFVAYKNAFFGQGSTPIKVGGFECSATEQGNILDCSHNSSPDCSHAQDAGVLCRPVDCTNGELRLVNGGTQLEGNVEVCRNGSWGSICDSRWSNVQAAVVCRQLQYSLIGRSITNCFGDGSSL